MEDLFIKAATVIAVGLATFSSFPGTAQQDLAAQPHSISSSSGTQDGDHAAANPAAPKLRSVSGDLVSNLDAKSAKQGDSVIVRIDRNLRIASGTEIPKGSKLVGHVTNVQRREEGRENLQIAILFDGAELKDGQSVPIESVIQDVAPSGPYGMIGNTAPGNYGAARPTTRAQSGTTDQNTTRNSSAPGLSSGRSAPDNIVAQNGNVAIRATAIPDVLLANDIHGMPFANASGLLLSSRHDLHLDGGTRFVIAVAASPVGEGGGLNR